MAQTQPSFHPTLCLIMDNQNDIDWKKSQPKIFNGKKGNGQPKVMTSVASSITADDFNLNPWINREVKTLSSLESNCESETSEYEMEADETTVQPLLEMDNDYITFCNELTKSPDKDAASSRLFCASVSFAGSFCFAIADDDESDFTDDDDDDDDDEEEENKTNKRDDRTEQGHHDFECLEYSSTHYCNSSSAKFDPFTISGLFLPSLHSPEIGAEQPPSLIFGAEAFCSFSSCDVNEEEWLENNEKLKEVNRKWLEEYDSSGISTNESSVKGAAENDTRKMVHFATDDAYITIPNKFEWADDYEDARKGPWEQCYRDHLRFAKRIESASDVLSRILDSSHRSAVFRNLYEHTDNEHELVDVHDGLINLTAISLC